MQQWSGLIAVNYPARHRGVKRHLNVTEARSSCPSWCACVETIGDDEGGHVDAETAEDDAHDAAGVGVPTTEKTDGTSRQAIAQGEPSPVQTRVVEGHVRAGGPVQHVERASIDEAYVDVTREVDAAVATRPCRRRRDGPRRHPRQRAVVP